MIRPGSDGLLQRRGVEGVCLLDVDVEWMEELMCEEKGTNLSHGNCGSLFAHRRFLAASFIHFMHRCSHLINRNRTSIL